jgi:putative hydrolase of the HAD superfamily
MLNFIFDLDDTLLSTEQHFSRAQQEFLAELERLGFNRDICLQIFIETDFGNVERWGFTPKRFYTSMGETYEILCRHAHAAPDSAIRRQLEDIGRGVFDESPRIMKGALQVLQTLKDYGDQLFLWTKGDNEIQLRKLAFNSLEQHFRQIYIFEQKTAAELLSIVKQHHLALADTWVVGDSIRSDINPALEIGANAIWLDVNSWSYERVEPLREDFCKISNIEELLAIYPKLLPLR